MALTEPLTFMHLRLSAGEIEAARALAAELGIPVAPAVRRLIREAAAQRRQPPPASPSTRVDTELNLHLLVAIEQVIALIESFVPGGPGTAQRLLPEAVLAAQRRMELEGEA